MWSMGLTIHGSQMLQLITITGEACLIADSWIPMSRNYNWGGMDWSSKSGFLKIVWNRKSFDDTWRKKENKSFMVEDWSHASRRRETLRTGILPADRKVCRGWDMWSLRVVECQCLLNFSPGYNVLSAILGFCNQRLHFNIQQVILMSEVNIITVTLQVRKN